MKPLYSSVVFFIVELEINSVNVSNVVNPLCYEVQWDPTQFKHKEMENIRNFL